MLAATQFELLNAGLALFIFAGGFYRRSYIHDGGPVGIAVSVVIVIIAALNLVVPRMSASAC